MIEEEWALSRATHGITAVKEAGGKGWGEGGRGEVLSGLSATKPGVPGFLNNGDSRPHGNCFGGVGGKDSVDERASAEQ